MRIGPPHPAGQPAGVLGLQRGIANLRHNRHRTPQRLQAALGGVDAVIGDDRLNDELKHRDAVRDEIAHGGIATRQPQIARIHAIRGDGDKGLTGEVLLTLERTHRRFLAGLVAVEGVDELAVEVGIIQHKPPQHLQVLAAKRRATGRHGGAHAGGMHGHHVRVAFDDDRLVRLGNIPLGQVEAEEHLGLAVQHGLRGVHVLAQLVVIEKLAGTEPDDVAGQIFDRPQQAPVEAINGAAFPHLGNAGLFQLLEGKALPQKVLRRRVPAGRGVATLKVVDRIAGKPAVEQEVAGRGRLRGLELFPVELVDRPVGLDEPLTGAGLFRPRASASSLVVDVVADLFRDRFHGLGERQLLHFHEEGKDVAALVSGKAVVVAALRAHVERRGLFVLER